MPGLQLMDTTIRDGQQSLWATRMSLGDMPVSYTHLTLPTNSLV